MTKEEKYAILSANPQSGRIPASTDPKTVRVLKEKGLVLNNGLTMKGRMTRERLVDAEMNF